MANDNRRFPRTPYVLISLGALLLAAGSYAGLFIAPICTPQELMEP